MGRNRKAENRPGHVARHIEQMRAAMRDMAEGGFALKELTEVVQKVYCLEALRACRGNATQAAELVKVNRNTFAAKTGRTGRWTKGKREGQENG